MKCWHCNNDLIWGGDHDLADEDPNYEMVTNLHCPVCDAEVEDYVPKKPKER